MAAQLSFFDAQPSPVAPEQAAPVCEPAPHGGLPPTPWADRENLIYAEERRLGTILPRPLCPHEWFWPNAPAPPAHTERTSENRT